MDIIKNLKKIYGDNFTFYAYKNITRTKVVCKCNKCGKEYIRGYNYLIREKSLKCSCEKEKKWTNEKILSLLNKKTNNFTFKIIENVDENGNAKILCICNKCKSSFTRKFRTLRFCNIKCEKCEREIHNKLKEEFVLNFIENKNYEIISGNYENEDSLFILKCKDCGNIVKTTYKNLKQQKKGCSACQYNKMRKDDETFKKEVKEKYNGNIESLEPYKGVNNKIKVKCNICNNEWYTTPDSLINKNIGCHICSKGVSYPNKFMKNLLLLFKDVIWEIEEEKQLNKINKNWTFGKHKFDFLINGKTVIEMDGGLHKNYLEIDKLKDDFAEKNGLEVIRINCDYPRVNERFEFIKNNTLNSKLGKILSLDKITDEQWNKINEKSITTYKKEIYDFYVKNQKMSYKKIAKVFNRHPDTISKTIKFFKSINEKF